MTGFLQDLRVAARGLVRRPGFSGIAVLALALGIGANTAIFSVIDAMLLRALPYPDPDRLVRVYRLGETGREAATSGYRAEGWRAASRSFDEMAAFRRDSFTIDGPEGPTSVSGALVARGFFRVMGVRPLLGRLISEEATGGREVVLSARMWRSRFDGARDVVGRTMTINGEQATVIGVVDDSFAYPVLAQLWLSPRWAVPEHPLRPAKDPTLNNDSNFLDVVARIRPDTTLEQARAEMNVVNLAVNTPDQPIGAIRLVPLRDSLVGETRTQLLVMFVAVGLILLIACANVAHLLLARALTRQHEIAVRLALGASRARLMRLFFAESLLLAGLGAALGVLLALWGAPPLVALGPTSLRNVAVTVDARVLAFTTLVALGTALLFGILPALSRRAAPESLSDRTATTDARRGRLRAVLLGGEVALSLVLLVGAGLLVRSLVELASVDPGFRARTALTAEVSLPAQRYPEPEQRAQFHARLVETLRAIPGVEAAGAVSRVPLSRGNSSRTVNLDDGRDLDADLRVVTPGYLDALGVPLLTGRDFTTADRRGAARVVLVNAAFARLMYPDGQALGHRVTVDLDGESAEIVGVVGDLHHTGLDRDVNPEIYTAAAVDPWPFMTFVVRGPVAPEVLAASMRRAVHEVDGQLAINEIMTMDQRIDTWFEGRRFAASVLGVLAGLAALLALVGIYGVISFSVAQRTRELGIRSALGARPRELLLLVVGQSMRPVLLGVVAGLLGAFGATRLLASMLFGVSTADPLTFVIVPVALASCAALAALAASRRATRVDPMVALRSEN